ncbi:MAG: SEC-C metal-binding domain-containing protein [Phycisphaeraceae bacterium]
MTPPPENQDVSPPSVGRNAPCPCGSGKKFKRCCEGKTWNTAEHRKQLLSMPMAMLLGLLVVGAVLVWVVAEVSSGPTHTGASAPSSAPAMPEPWFYNEATNQHWDPGHNHWHDGPPPPASQR